MLELAILSGVLLAIIAVLPALIYRAPPSSTPLKRYILADRAVTPTGFMSTLTASNAALANIIFLYAYWGYVYGIYAVFWGSLFWITGILVFLYATRVGYFLKLTSSSQTALGLDEIVGRLFNSRTVLFAAAVASTLTFTALLSLEIGIGSNALLAAISVAQRSEVVIGSYPSYNVWPGVIFSLAVAAYCFKGGFPTVVKTDEYQLIGILLAVIATPIAIDCLPTVRDVGMLGLVKWSAQTSSLFRFDLGYTSFVFGSIFSWGVWFLVTKDNWQRTLSVGSAGAFSPGAVVLGLCLLIIVSASGAIIGIAIKYLHHQPFPPRFPVVDFLGLLAQQATSDWTAAVSLALIIGGFLCAMASTVDTYMVVVAHSVYGDLMSVWRDRWFSEEQGNNEVKIVRRLEYVAFATPPISIFLYFFATAVAVQDNFTLYMIAGSLPMSLVPIMWHVLFNPTVAQDRWVGYSVGILISIAIITPLNFVLANTALTTFDQKYFAILYFTPLLAAVLAAIPPLVLRRY